jgi:2-methylcitrate dehydratase PrpD
MCRLGASATEKFHERGFQATSACGTIGAAVAVGNLLGLNRRQFEDAMGIAANLAFGSCLSVRLSSYCSNIDTGRAAETGIIAALLARSGVHANVDDVLEGKFGFLSAHVGEGNYDRLRLLRGLKETWEINNTFLKRYPMGYDFTRYIDAVFKIRTEHDFSASDVAAINYGDNAIAIGRFSEPSERKRRPSTKLEASTSRYYVIAAAITDNEINSRTFSTSRIESPTLSRLMNRTHYVVDESDHWVEVVLKNGKRHKVVQDELVPTARDRAVQKFYDNALEVTSLKQAKQVYSLVDSLDELEEVGELCKSMASVA